MLSNLFRAEETFTLLFIAIFLAFGYQYVKYDEIEQSVFSRETIKTAMWASAFFAVAAHLMPKANIEKEEKNSKQVNLTNLNDKLRENLLTALKVEEQSQLEHLKQKQTLKPRS